MINLRTQIIFVIALGFLSLIAGGISHLALTDIYHGELDLSLEWRVVQMAALIVFVFIGFSLITLWRVLKRVGKPYEI